MSNSVSVSIENLSKVFRVPASGADAGKRGKYEDFWALKDVSLEVKQGEVIGLIGHNGAGKSTLLKILSRIMRPSEGRVAANGEIAALLEVGTGFHPDLTGRENVRLNGSILGISQKDVNALLPDIIEFSGVGDFIDTPVKHYSSGMVVRLGFAVAVNLKADIVIIDEVLSVGDARFQRKCEKRIQKMVREEGRTVFVVSHNLASINALCDRVYLLERGKLVAEGAPGEVINQYKKLSVNLGGRSEAQGDSEGNVIGDECAEFIEARVVRSDQENPLETDIDRSESFRVAMKFRLLQEDGASYVPNFHFHGKDGPAFVSGTEMKELKGVGEFEASCEIPGGLLNCGTFTVDVALTSYLNKLTRVHFFERAMLVFHISEDMEKMDYVGDIPGPVRPDLDWEFEQLK